MIEAALESLLFVAGEPVTLLELSKAVDLDELSTEAALRSLQISLTERGSGLQALRIAGGWQLATRSEHAEVVGRLLARGVNKLSRAALETLAIVAYRQPITAPEIEAVRGVSSDSVVQTLLDRRLIAEAGRKASIGRPMLYRTTADFLHYFGISDLSQLPVMDLVSSPAPTIPGSQMTVVTGGEQLPKDREVAESLPGEVGLGRAGVSIMIQADAVDVIDDPVLS